MVLEERRDNATTFGSTNQGPCGVRVNTAATTVSYFSLVDNGGTERYLWFDTTGRLRTSTSIPADPNSGGTIIGSQS